MSQKFTAPVRRGLDYIRDVAVQHVNDGHAIKLTAAERREIEMAVTWMRENGAKATENGAGGDTHAPPDRRRA